MTSNSASSLLKHEPSWMTAMFFTVSNYKRQTRLCRLSQFSCRQPGEQFGAWNRQTRDMVLFAEERCQCRQDRGTAQMVLAASSCRLPSIPICADPDGVGSKRLLASSVAAPAVFRLVVCGMLRPIPSSQRHFPLSLDMSPIRPGGQVRIRYHGSIR